MTYTRKTESKVTARPSLGVLVCSGFKCDGHVDFILSVCSRRVHLLKLLRGRGLQFPQLHIICQSLIVFSSRPAELKTRVRCLRCVASPCIGASCFARAGSRRSSWSERSSEVLTSAVVKQRRRPRRSPRPSRRTTGRSTPSSVTRSTRSTLSPSEIGAPRSKTLTIRLCAISK